MNQASATATTERLAHVYIVIEEGPAVPIPWTLGMSVRDALEVAAIDFNYALQYYGEPHGYHVSMIGQTCDSTASSPEPHFYWTAFLDGAPLNHGVERTQLEPGASISFQFTKYSLPSGANRMLEAKHAFLQSQSQPVEAVGAQNFMKRKDTDKSI